VDDANTQEMKHAQLTEAIIGVFYSVYNELGHGFLESVYEEAMAVSLQEKGFTIQRQFPVPVWFHGMQIGEFRGDLVVNDLILLELKAIQRLETSQLMNYLRATRFELGLLLNFGPKPEVRRRIVGNQYKNLSLLSKTASAQS
jgi:GxxExxY protein